MSIRVTLLVALLAALAVSAPAETDPAESSAVARVGELTLEEKAAMVTGRNSWETFEVPRLGLPPVWMADGPVGLRKSTGENVSDSVPATCFPSSAAMAATWNETLIEELGAAIGREARENGVSLLLAPGLNIKRHPLGGRNFEYYSEDPLLAGRMAAAFVRGVQSQGVGATLKHFAVNNQEYRRMSIDAQVDERALREIYLRGFEIAVKESQPQAVMTAYNLVNGTSATENPLLLTQILREEWGYEGLVVSDWGAVNEAAAAVAAGLDLEMPGNPLTPPTLLKAVQSGELDEAHLDRAVAKVLQLVDRHQALAISGSEAATPHHELARKVAAESIVLLANDGLLPLEEGAGRSLGVVGRLAVEPRIQGIGSSQINALEVEAAWPFLEEMGEARGFQTRHWGAEIEEDGLAREEREQLSSFVGGQDLVVAVVGQKASHDAEAWDRPSATLAPSDLEILDVLRESGKPHAVVLVGGGSIEPAPFAEANAVVMGWLGGEAFGSAIAQVLFGVRSPSGKLSETFAWSVNDHASALNFPGGPIAVRYGEGLFVGYRYFSSFDQEVAYPFGHGLSYTTFSFSDARAPETLARPEPFEVSVVVTNAGDRAGAETVQLYLRPRKPARQRVDRALIGFAKIFLEPGESRSVTLEVGPRELAYYSDVHDRWVVEAGSYELLLGVSSADLRASLSLTLEQGTVPPTLFTADHTIGDIYQDPRGKAVLDFVLEQAGRGPISLAGEDPFFAAIFQNLPFKKLRNFSQGAIDDGALFGLLMLINSPTPPDQVRAMLEQGMAARRAAEE